MIVDPRDFTPEAIGKIAPQCGECGPGSEVILVPGEVIYPARPDLWATPDGAERWWWKCRTCNAYCGTHLGTLKALGTPAGSETRRAREAAHALFDPLWQKRQRLSGLSRSVARGRGYKWLAGQLGMDRRDCHIGQMDADTARRVVDVCRGAREQ